MTMSQELKGEIYGTALKLKEYVLEMKLVYRPFQQLVRNPKLVDQQKLGEVIGEELWESLDRNDTRASEIMGEARKLVLKIVGLLESKE